MIDVLIIGAGTAGCVLADRLTHSGKLNVTLIEAGARPTSKFVSIPAGFPRLLKSDHDWAFESEPQTSVGGRVIFTPRGKMLGGSSNMNAQIHQWCHPADFDGWVRAGATGWGWDEVRPIFSAQECWTGDDDADRGRTGPMVISNNSNVLPLSHAFVKAARKLLGDMAVYNGKDFKGAWLCEIAHKNGKRFSAYDAFLKPAMARQNLTVITNAHVKKILFEERRATGAVFLQGGVERTLSSSHVVLAAGAFGSPQILMHSGIGAAEALRPFGIPVITDSPDVGQNLQDHPILPLGFRSRGSVTMKSAESLSSLFKYIVLRRGMLASNGVEAFAFTNVGSSDAAPDLELIFVPLEMRDQFLEPPQVDGFGIGAAVVAPRSRGQVRLKTADAMDAPAIDFGLLTDPEGFDASMMLKGVRLAREIAATSPLCELNAGELRPGESVQSDDDVLGYAAKELQTVYHPTSTCRMGADDRAVVDPQLKLKGVDGVWVADASVMPSVPRGHPNAVVAMIADRAANWIEETLAH